MPYIPNKQRFEKLFKEMCKGENIAINPGEVNYLVFSLIMSIWEKSLKNYASISAIISALEGAKFEFQRLIVGPYENQKLMYNFQTYEEVKDERKETKGGK